MGADWAIVGGEVVTPERILSPGRIVVAEGRIAQCGEVDQHEHGGDEDAAQRTVRRHARPGSAS